MLVSENKLNPKCSWIYFRKLGYVIYLKVTPGYRLSYEEPNNETKTIK